MNEPPLNRFRLPPRERLALALTLGFGCNLACTYCYVRPQSGAVLGRERTDRALDLAFASLLPGGLLDLGFFGGEPLLFLDDLLEVCRQARTRAAVEGQTVRVALTTNGTLLTPEVAGRLVAAGVEVTVSLDGVAEAHDLHRRSPDGAGSHARALAGLDAALAAGLTPAAHLVVDPATLERLAEGVEALVAEGVTRVVLGPNFDATWTEADLARAEGQYQRLGELYVERMQAGRAFALSFLEEKLRRAVVGEAAPRERCGFGIGELAVDPHGRLFPCERLIEDGGGDDWVIGDLECGLDPDRLATLRQPLCRPADDCLACALRPLCTSSCPCTNLSRTGRLNEPDGLVCFLEELSVRVAESVLETLHPDLAEDSPGGDR